MGLNALLTWVEGKALGKVPVTGSHAIVGQLTEVFPVCPLSMEPPNMCSAECLSCFDCSSWSNTVLN